MNGYGSCGIHIYTHNVILLSYKIEFFWVSSNEVVEPCAYYTGWSKSEKDKYYILTHTHMESRKMVLTILWGGQQKRDRHKEKFLDTMGEGVGGMIWENSIETYTLP